MSKKSELRKLLPELEKLPEETRGGLVSFLKLLLAVDRSLEKIHLETGEIQEGEQDLGATWSQSKGITEDFRELLRLLGQNLQGQEPERRDLVLSVLAGSGKAYELGGEATGRLLLQVAIIMTAGQESSAAAQIQGTACAAALAIAKGS